MSVKNLLKAGIAALTLTAAGAQANLLTNDDFETNTFGTLLSAPNAWGGEANSGLIGADAGVTPFDNQMLYIGDAGGGSAAQVAQYVYGTFTAGSTVTFDVYLNAAAAGAVAYLQLDLETWGGQSQASSFSLDDDANTWEQMTISRVLTTDVSRIFAQIWAPIVSGSAAAHYVETTGYIYGDNASLTVTPVPAPAALSFMLFGLLSLGISRKLRK